jgi:hypothetical protein
MTINSVRPRETAELHWLSSVIGMVATDISAMAMAPSPRIYRTHMKLFWSESDVDHTTYQGPRLNKIRAILLLPVWAFMAGYRVTLTCKVCNINDRIYVKWPSYWLPTHEFRYRTVKPRCNATVHRNLWRYIVDGGTSKHCTITQNFCSRIFKSVKWGRRNLEVWLYFWRISLVSSERQSLSIPFYLLLPCVGMLM